MAFFSLWNIKTAKIYQQNRITNASNLTRRKKKKLSNKKYMNAIYKYLRDYDKKNFKNIYLRIYKHL